jgi:hypothetical protein
MRGPEDQEPPEASPPGQRSDRGGPSITGTVPPSGGYQRSERTDMRQLIDATRR